MDRAIATIELISIARGFTTADVMLKSGNVSMLFASPICPGKYLIVVGGQVGAVENALKNGLETAGEMAVDHSLLPNIHGDIFPAIARATPVSDFKALGIVETMSAPAAFEGADAAVKAARVDLIEIRLGRGMGAKSLFLFTGEIAEARTAAAAAEKVIAGRGLLVDIAVLTRPHRDLKDFVF